MFKRDWEFQARLKFSIGIEFSRSQGPLGIRIARFETGPPSFPTPLRKKSLSGSPEESVQGLWELYRAYTSLFGTNFVSMPKPWPQWSGGIYGWARETGAICQIGVLTQKRCIFWAQKGLFWRPCLCPNATKQSNLPKIHFFTRSQNLEGEITIFTVSKWGKEQNHYENHDLGHNHWKRSAKRPKINPFWTQNVHGFQVKTPIWQMAPISRIYGGGGVLVVSSENKLPFMILKPQGELQKNTFSSRKMHFPADNRIFLQKKCIFVQKHAVLGGHIAGNRRKLQEGFRAQESRTLANFHKIVMHLGYQGENVCFPRSAPSRELLTSVSQNGIQIGHIGTIADPAKVENHP